MKLPGILVTGCRGLLGGLFMNRLGDRAVGADLPEVDLAVPGTAARLVASSGAEIVLNCAALTDVDFCETHPGRARRLHAEVPAELADAARVLVTFSTDHVFTGPSSRPWVETDPVSPANAYARSKLAGEEAVLARPSSLVVRTSWLFHGERGIVPWIARSLRKGSVRAVTDQEACATYAPDLVGMVLRMLDDGASGLFHVVNPGVVTPYSLAVEMAGDLGGEAEPVTWAGLGLPAPRPVYSALSTVGGYVPPALCDALGRWRASNE